MNRFSTPDRIFAVLNREFRFSIDLCADPDNAKCEKWLSRGESLNAKWEFDGWGWLNPPYGREITPWVAKAARCGYPIVAMLPGRTNPPWWHDHVLEAAMVIRCVRRKVSFYDPNGKKGVPVFGSVLAIFAKHEGPTLITSWDWKTA